MSRSRLRDSDKFFPHREAPAEGGPRRMQLLRRGLALRGALRAHLRVRNSLTAVGLGTALPGADAWAKSRGAVPARFRRAGDFAHPHMWCLESSTQIGRVFVERFGRAAARGAMGGAARRRGRGAPGLASEACCSSQHHLISGRAALARTHIPHACGEEAKKDETHLQQRLCDWPKGGTVIIHPALTAVLRAPLRRRVC